ncbi:YjdJ family protein [Halobacillus sp. Marseille-Q1614]|uniref:YjdJ family protein n=1 Tax=Halobacillus sp. Marseille-Q1614 TaxID=2709134 RepID=UPI0015701F3F|nr:YjdJ family protein [Halobacillus sp. Marseille-Q1614]
MYWFLIQLCISLSLLVFSTFVTWYEGSALLENPWEWEYSTPFSERLHENIHSDEQISQLDYFVYAAKFHPTFPTIMAISSIYLILLIGYQFLKAHIKKLTLYLSLWGIIFLATSFFIMNSPTSGGKIFTSIYMVSGVLCFSIVGFTFFKRTHKPSAEKV